MLHFFFLEIGDILTVQEEKQKSGIDFLLWNPLKTFKVLILKKSIVKNDNTSAKCFQTIPLAENLIGVFGIHQGDSMAAVEEKGHITKFKVYPDRITAMSDGR